MTGCQAVAADPAQHGRLLTCSNPVAGHDGIHRAHGVDGELRTWGSEAARRPQPGPDPDWFEAYASGDQLAIAAARGRYSEKLIAAGFPGLVDPLDWAADR